MIYVYIAMASREGVLLLNGSSIRPWWIWHHYLAAFTCIIFLMMPVDSPAVQRYVEGWLHWTVAQAALMLAQDRCSSCLLAPAAGCFLAASRDGCHLLARCYLLYTFSPCAQRMTRNSSPLHTGTSNHACTHG